MWRIWLLIASFSYFLTLGKKNKTNDDEDDMPRRRTGRRGRQPNATKPKKSTESTNVSGECGHDGTHISITRPITRFSSHLSWLNDSNDCRHVWSVRSNIGYERNWRLSFHLNFHRFRFAFCGSKRSRWLLCGRFEQWWPIASYIAILFITSATNLFEC